MPNFKKLLILGAKGNLGQQLVKVFADFDVTVWDREDVDLGNQQDLHVKIGNLRPDLVINTVAYNDVDGAEGEGQRLAYLLNDQAVGWLSDICVDIDAMLVHYSTDYVFDGRNLNGYKEDDPPAPINEYGKSKMRGENQLRGNFYLIRTSRLFGPRQNFASHNLSGQASTSSKLNFVEKILKLAKEKPFLEIIDEEVSAPTYTRDLAKATRDLILSDSEPDFYHLVNLGACTWYGWAKKILELAKINIELRPVPASRFPRPAKRPRYSVLLNTKRPHLRRWEESLEEYLRIT